MKYRKLPYGYCFSEGCIITEPKEAIIINEIVQMYLDRFSLMSIAEVLTARKIEIAPGLTEWNKARVMHLLADERYTGNDKYPQIIDRSTYETIKEIRQQKNCRTEWNPDADIFKLAPPVHCPCCGSRMQRKHEKRCKQKIRWLCQNSECGEIIPFADETLIEGISKIARNLAMHPENVRVPAREEMRFSLAVRQKDNEIRKAIGDAKIEEHQLQKMIADRVTQMYLEIPRQRYISMEVQNEFRKYSSDEKFPVDLIARTVRSISFSEEGQVSVVLKNGQDVVEGQYGADR